MRFSKAKKIDFCIGINLIAWGIIGFFSFPFSIPRISITVLNCLIGVLIIIRHESFSIKGVFDNLVSIPAILLGGILFKIAMPLEKWSFFSQFLFCIGVILTIFSFLFLGKSFSIRPALQKIVSHGPYQWIRHPAYLGEFLMMIACYISQKENVYFLIGLVVLLLLQMVRIVFEEKILSQSENYQVYQQKVKWRLVPFVW